MNSKVYIFQSPKPRKSDGWTPDLSTAAEHGTLVPIFDQDDVPHTDPSTAVNKAAMRLMDFDPSRDFLLWPNFADTASQWIACMVLVQLGHTSLSFLYWNKGTRGSTPEQSTRGYYYPIKVDVSKLYRAKL